ncbi:MAG: DNA repair protein RecO [Acidimicrobiales bacterium]
MALYREHGVVLRTHKLGEADRIVVLLTAGRGKVRAVAKGVRKTKSRFGSRLEPPTHVSLLLYEGRQLATVTQAEAVDHFRPIRDDLDRMTDALVLLEAVDQVAQEGEADPQLYRMLVGALRTLAEQASPLLVAGFYWKLLGVQGVAPILDRCARCGAGPGGDLVAFDPVEGGALCRACRRGPAVTPEALAVIRAILGGDLRTALTLPAGPVTAEVSDLAVLTLEAHLERRLRAVRLLHR